MKENFSMEWNMEWKIFSMEWKWNGKKLLLRNMEKSSSIPFYTMPWTQVVLIHIYIIHCSDLIFSFPTEIDHLNLIVEELKNKLKKETEKLKESVNVKNPQI